MSERLAVFTNDLGASFIDFHITDIAPGRAVAVGKYGGIPIADLWPVGCPALFFETLQRSVGYRVLSRLGYAESSLLQSSVRRFLKRHRVTHVLGEYLDQFIEFAPLMNKMNIPYVVQAHGYDVSQCLRDPVFVAKLDRYQSARAILTRCGKHRSRLIDLGLPPERIFVNMGGVHVPDRIPIRSDDAEDRFLAIGMMVPKKGPMYLLEAFRLLTVKRPNARLDWIGGGSFYPAVLQAVRAAGLGGRIRLHGYAPEETKKSLLSECGVFVQHSITDPDTGNEEGLPAAIQEAMAHGLAVVSTRHAGISEAVVEGITGFLVDEGDVNGMAAAMAAASKRFRELGEAGYGEAAEKHDWRHERDRLRYHLFGSLLGTT
jgi:colanic acid/amylovoran biosynthesis glycosyltransferase